jgi:hypothetical protein
MNWQASANGISLGMHFFVTQNAILAFQAFDLIFVFRCTLWRTSQWFACKADMLAFQIAAIIT